MATVFYFLLCPPSKHYQTPEPNLTHFNLTMTIQTRRKAIAFMKISNKNTSTSTTSLPQHTQLPKPNHFRWVSQYCKLIQIKNKSRLLTLQKQKAILAIDLLHNSSHLKQPTKEFRGWMTHILPCIFNGIFHSINIKATTQYLFEFSP